MFNKKCEERMKSFLYFLFSMWNIKIVDINSPSLQCSRMAFIIYSKNMLHHSLVNSLSHPSWTTQVSKQAIAGKDIQEFNYANHIFKDIYIFYLQHFHVTSRLFDYVDDENIFPTWELRILEQIKVEVPPDFRVVSLQQRVEKFSKSFFFKFQIFTGINPPDQWKREIYLKIELRCNF